jgi:hypothetical protein
MPVLDGRTNRSLCYSARKDIAAHPFPVSPLDFDSIPQKSKITTGLWLRFSVHQTRASQLCSTDYNAKNAIERIDLEATSEKLVVEYPVNKFLEETRLFPPLLERHEIGGNAGVGSVAPSLR